MKRVLLTGFTATQVGRVTGPKLVGQQPGAIRAALEHGGVEVDHRIVLPGENLSGYDGAVVCLMSLLSLTTTYALGALWTLSQRPCVLVVNDGATAEQVAKQLRVAAGNPDHYLVEVMSACKRRGIATLKGSSSVRSKIYREVARLAKSWDHHRVALPFFAWGDPRTLDVPASDPRGYDPSSFAIPYDHTPRPARDRHRHWVLASLFDQSRWVDELGVRWPVVRLGNERHGGTKVPEAAVVQAYADNWGMLVHAYRHGPRGWWRSRYLHAMQTGTPILADRDELELIGPGAYYEAGEIEAASVPALQRIARAQADLIRPQLWSARKLANFFTNLTLKGK